MGKGMIDRSQGIIGPIESALALPLVLAIFRRAVL